MNILLFLKGLTSFGSYRPNFLTEFEIWLQNDLLSGRLAMKFKILQTIFDKHNPSSKKLGLLRDHPFKTSACLMGGGVFPCANGQKVTIHKDQKYPFCWSADGRGVGVKNRKNLPTS